MEPTTDRDVKTQKAYDVAIETRTLEIELFWKRAIFFWAFVAAAFAAFSSTYDKHPALALLVSGFGVICSVTWSLANRGSKYWQQTWESRVEKLEQEITGPLFGSDSNVQTNAPYWLRAQRFSVSKLTIALADCITLLWSLLATMQLLCVLGHKETLQQYAKIGAVTFFVGIWVYTAAIVVLCRTSTRGGVRLK